MNLHTRVKSHRTLLFFYICALFFFYLCTFLFLSLSAPRFYCGLSLSLLATSLVSSSVSVCGDDFLLDANSNFFHCQPLTTETLHTALCPVLFKSTDSCSDPFSLPPSLNFPVFCSSSSVQGGPDAPRHAQATGLHPLRVHFGHSLPHRRHPDAVRGRVHPRRRLH